MVIEDKFKEMIPTNLDHKAHGKITLKELKPDEVIYQSESDGKKLAVFSEIYYQPGWQAFIDGKEAPHFRVNFLLRGMVIPEGKHEITFRFEPKSYYVGEKVSLAGSFIFGIIFLFIIGKEIFEYFKKEKDS